MSYRKTDIKFIISDPEMVGNDFKFVRFETLKIFRLNTTHKKVKVEKTTSKLEN